MYITLRPTHNDRHFADDMFKCIFLNENIWIPIMISLKFVPKGQFDNIQHWFTNGLAPAMREAII